MLDPRLVIFNPELGFQPPFLAKIWDNRLMLRVPGADQPVTVFFQKPGQIEGQTFIIEPRVVDLAYLMGHKPTLDSPENGLDLTYSQVVNAVYQLYEQGFIPGTFELQANPLATAIAEAQNNRTDQPRPESAPTDSQAPFDRRDLTEPRSRF